MRRFSIFFVLLLLLCLSVDVIQAEDQQNNDEQAAADEDAANDDAVQEDVNDDAVQEEANDDAVQEEANDDAVQEDVNDDAVEEEAEDANYNANDVDNSIQVCSDAIIQVQSVSIHCDSPGTYYYGSGKYRNSETCMPGDKAKVQISFYIADHDVIQQAGNYALVDVYVDGGSYTSAVQVYDNADLCSLSSLRRQSGVVCPYNGYFQISTQFYWGNGKNNNEEVFQPTVHVGFRSNSNVYAYDYGGANTNLCRGSTFATWGGNIASSYSRALGTFMKSFGILLFTIVVMGAFIRVLSKKPTSFAEAKAQLLPQRYFQPLSGFKKQRFSGLQKHRDMSINENEEFDFRKISTAKSRNLVDF